MNTPSRILIIVPIIFSLFFTVYGQVPAIKSSRIDDNNNIAFVVFDQRSELPSMASGKEFLIRFHNANDKTSFKLVSSDEDNYGFTHKKYQQYHQGIKVFGGEYIIHDNGSGSLSKMNGHFHDVNLESVSPSLKESEALDYALNYINAEKYSWHDNSMDSLISMIKGKGTSYPTGELVIINRSIKNSNEWILTWAFNIKAIKPYSSQIIYVNADSGIIEKNLSLIHNTNSTGSAETYFSGTKTIVTDSHSGSYRLREDRNGVGIQTLDIKNGDFDDYPSDFDDFTDNNNTWTGSEHGTDQYALD